MGSEMCIRDRHLTASLREQPAQASVPPLHLLFGASDQLGVMPQGIHTGIESPRQEARFAGPALCQLLRNSAEEPTQASTSRLVRSALRQHAVLLPASRSASKSIASRAASASLGTASAPSFWCFRPARSYAPGHTHGNRIPRQEARFAGPALCQLLRNSAEEPTQASTTRHVRSGPRQLVVLLPASCSAYDY